MKKTLLLLLVVSLSTSSLLAGDKERNIGSAAEGGAFSATAKSMMAWGLGLAVVAGGLAALFQSSGGGGGSCGH